MTKKIFFLKDNYNWLYTNRYKSSLSIEKQDKIQQKDEMVETKGIIFSSKSGVRRKKINGGDGINLFFDMLFCCKIN
jgi:hypothetical protein